MTSRSLTRRRYTARHVGRVRERLSEMLVAAFAKVDEQCRSEPAHLRPQQGCWRTDFRMDVCRWEGSVELFRHGKWNNCPIHSWSTMSDCVRFGLTLREEQVYGCFEAFANDDLKSFKRRGRVAPVEDRDAELLRDGNSHYSEQQNEEIAMSRPAAIAKRTAKA